MKFPRAKAARKKVSAATGSNLHKMASFSLPPINDNPDGGWGPSSSNFPDKFKFKDIPYAPYSKSDKLGRFADWNDASADNRQSAAGLSNIQNVRGGGPGGRRRDGNQAFGSGTASAFAYFHVEDESSFSLVDNKAAPPRRGGFARGRGAARGTGGYNRGGVQRGRGGLNTGRGGNQRGGRRGGWRDWEKVCLFSLCTHSEFASKMLLEQPDSRIFSSYIPTMVNVGGDRVPQALEVKTRSRRARRSVRSLQSMKLLSTSNPCFLGTRTVACLPTRRHMIV